MPEQENVLIKNLDCLGLKDDKSLLRFRKQDFFYNAS